MKVLRTIAVAYIACGTALFATAQNYTSPFNHMLLDEKSYDYIVGESSGDRAYNYILDIAPYERDRSHAEYAGHFFESEYILGKLKSYGIKNAQIETVSKSSSWDGKSASLWEISPKLSKIADYGDMTAFLAQGSSSADVEAELVWIGSDSSESEISKADVAGKIVVTDASGSAILSKLAGKGVYGAISFASSRPLRDPLQIPNSSIRTENSFCFNIAPRDGYPLRDRLLKGEKIRVHAKVETTTEETNNEVVTCVIEGKNPDAGEVIFVAHLFEGYVKLGANDNISGSAVLMEIARTLRTLIDEGKIAQPERSIRFLWVNEISGTQQWVAKHGEIVNKLLCGINLDMVGLWLSKDGSYFCGHRTLMGNPHYLNDVQESFFHYMGATNKGFVSTGAGRPDALKPVYSATGSRDPFYYSISAHYGSSDHEVFNDWAIQVPTTILNTWPDSYYHTSGDRPEVCDPTQLHRATVICAAMGYTIASATESGAMAIASEVASNAGKRMSVRMADDLSNLAKGNSTNFESLYKKARFNQDATLNNEVATLHSVMELAPASAALKSYIDNLSASLKVKSTENGKEIDAAAKAFSSALGMAAIKGIQLTDIEKKASKIYPKTTSKVKESGVGVVRTLSADIMKKYGVANAQGRSLLSHGDDVAKLTVDGSNSILDIKKMQDVQFPDADSLENIINYLEALKEAGLVEW
ncbi:MAG: M28 family peptidase [Bacteroidales bacterium]|nr:M28 family peptidase [Bacteroidales bacterium]